MEVTHAHRHQATVRPPGQNAGTQRWTDLIFVHVKVPVEAIRRLVPAELELDLWHGEALIGFVPFRMERIAPPFVPPALGLDFFETNVRTYVSRNGKPGVFFLSLEADSLLAVKVARAFWGLPYFYASMNGARVETPEGTRFHYESVRSDGQARFTLEALVPNEASRQATLPASNEPLSLEYFLLERYYLFVERDGKVHSGAVNHVPYPFREAKLLKFSETLAAAAGLPEVGPPFCVHASSGVDVEVFATKVES